MTDEQSSQNAPTATLHLGATRWLRMVVAGLLVAGAFVVSLPGTASAAEVDLEISNFTVVPTTNVNVNTNLALRFDFAVPDVVASGDTATFAVPEQLQESGLPALVVLRDGGGNPVANVTFSGADPATMVFTFLAYVDVNNNVAGNFTFSATLDDDIATGTTQTLTLTEFDGTTLDVDVDVVPTTTTARLDTRKNGFFPRSDDQCRVETEGCITWDVRSSLGPWTSIDFTDQLGSNMVFQCASLQVFIAEQDPATGSPIAHVPIEDVPGPAAVVNSCSDNDFDVRVTDVPTDRIVVIRILADAVEPFSAGLEEFSNQVTADYNGGQVIENRVGSRSSAQFSGGADGSNLRLVKRDVLGNDANTPGEAATLPDGSTQIVITITNTGSTGLNDLVVSDVITEGLASVDNLSCDFSEAAGGAPTSGVEWSGTFASGAEFTCTADLSGVAPGDLHTDVSTVTAVSDTVAGTTLERSDPYNAVRPAPEPLLSLGDLVWIDTNANGVFDGDEDGISGVPVTLFDGDGNELDTTTTDSVGRYSFTGLEAGSYQVGFGLPAGYTWTTSNSGADDSLDSDATFATDADPIAFTAVFALTTAAVADSDEDGLDLTNPTLDAGVVLTATSPTTAAPTPTTVPAPEPTTPPTTTPAPTGPDPTGLLPATGSDTDSILLVAFGLLLAGGIVVLATRRRSTDGTATKA